MPYVTRARSEDVIFSGLSVWLCHACGSHFAAPCPSEQALARYYRESYRADGRNIAAVEGFPLSHPWYHSRGLAVARLLKQFLGADVPPLELLDVGAGYGHVAYALRQVLGDTTRVTAIEPDPACHATLDGVADRVGGAEPLSAILAQQLPRRFSAVLLLHVLEHFADPFALLRQLSPLVAMDGVLVVEVPHCPPTRVRWYNAETPHVPHLVFFTPLGLRKVLERAGLSIAHLATYGPEFGADGGYDAGFTRTPLSAEGVMPYPCFGEAGPNRLFLRAVARARPGDETGEAAVAR